MESGHRVYNITDDFSLSEWRHLLRKLILTVSASGRYDLGPAQIPQAPKHLPFPGAIDYFLDRVTNILEDIGIV